MREPLILNIKGNSLDDGPGIRTTLFLKGCPLRCVWCHNPESKMPTAELSFDASKCIRCNACKDICPYFAIGTDPNNYIHRDLCKRCFKCTFVCPSKALSRVGYKMDLNEAFEKLVADKMFYDVSGGGVTFTGGEATLYSEWLGVLAERLHSAGVHVLLETCGYFDFETVSERLLPFLDIIYCDIKLFDRELHKKYCGVDNDLILENIQKLHTCQKQYGYEFLPRIPLIPEITDTTDNLNSIAVFLKELGISKVELLPYNPTWYTKVSKIGAKLNTEIASIKSWQSDEKMKEIKEIFLSYHIEC